MGLAVSWTSVACYAVGLLALFLIGKLLVKPFKWILKLICNALLGGLLLIFVNMVGNFFDFTIVINPVTSLIAGFLGVPGVVLLIFLTLLF